ncbi:MAG TPA: hypothetical protein VK327_08660 [Candidatus Paceibacterota bacterium]|nr:hypothetical protein [Candidatus Paceibacterota bacterium]
MITLNIFMHSASHFEAIIKFSTMPILASVFGLQIRRTLVKKEFPLCATGAFVV